MWLLSEEIARDIQSRIDSGVVITAEAHERFMQVKAAASDSGNGILSVRDSVAQIDVRGVLTEEPDFIMWLLGKENTAYSDIRKAIAVSSRDPDVQRIRFNVKSPGGHVDGLFETLGAIDAAGKPTETVTSEAASAAYAIAARTDRIVATTATTTIGSIGVAVDIRRAPDVVKIANTQSPKKRPDPSTEEGKAVVREYLDAMHDIIVDAIASGRGTTIDNVNATYGQGAAMVAADAMKHGMIDAITLSALRPAPRISAESQPDATAADPVAGEQVAESSAAPKPDAAPAGGAAHKKGKIMDLQTLKSEHPETYAAAVKLGREEGHTAGLEEGATLERKRANAHLKMGESCGDMKLAVAAVASGADFTDAEVQAQYMDARMNRADQRNRQKESDDAGAAVDGAAGEPEPKSADDQAVDIYCAQLGIK